jgi:NitT/TauT family transport system substrate-binding protein
MFDACRARGLIVALVFATLACAPAAQPSARDAAGAAPAPANPAAAASAPGTAAQPAAQPPAPPETVKLGSFYSLGAAPLFVGIDRGFFGKQGIEVEIQRTAGASEVMGFLAAGHLDVAAGGPSVPLYNSIGRGVPIKVVAPLGLNPSTVDRNNPELPLMVRKDLYDSGTVREVGQLRGRTIAMTGVGSTFHWHLARTLQEANLRIDDVELIAMDFPDQITGLATGRIDAALLSAPWDAQARRDGVAEVLVPNVAPGHMVTVLMASPQLMQERPDALRRFLTGYANAIRAMQREGYKTEENLAIIERYTGVKADTIRTSTFQVFDVDLAIDSRRLADYQQFLFGMKLVTYDTPLAESQLVDKSFAEYAAQRADKQ